MTASDDVVGLRVKVPSAELFVRVRGNGRPVLLLHGGGPGTSGDGWVACMAACAPGVQLIAPDFPGFGDSGPLARGEYGNPAFVAATLELMDALCLEHVTLAGHSMGSSVAAALAARNPQRIERLLLVAPGGPFFGFNDYASPGMEQITRTTREPTLANVTRLVELMSAQDAAGLAHQVETRMERLRNPTIIEVQRALLGGRVTPDAAATARRAELAARIRTFERPVELVWGAREAFNPMELAERIRSALPAGSAYHLVAGAGHNVQYDQPQAVARLLA